MAILRSLLMVGTVLLLSAFAEAQTALGSSSNVAVPRMVRYNGTLKNDSEIPNRVVGITFALYRDQESGSPLWLETQSVNLDTQGHYSIQLGSTTSDGLPTDLFTSGEARWLGVQPAGQAEQPRVLLLSVPYALKAGDAETVGGLPPSAFVLAGSPQASGTGRKSAPALASTAAAKTAAPPANPNVTGKGVIDFIPMWNTAADIVDSLIFQKSAQIGINTTAPSATLDVNGKGDVRDTLTLFPKGTDSTLAISGTTFKVDQTGEVNFVPGQKFPGTGTITGVATAIGSGLTGGGTGGTLNLGINSTVVPKLATANTFTNTNTVIVDSNGSPAMTLANHSGNGLNISNAGTNGIYIASTGNGIVMASVVGDGINVQGAAGSGITAIGQNDGGYFNGRVAGSYAQNDVDGNGSAAAYGYETGATNVTYGVVGYSASNKGIGTYGQAVSASTSGALTVGTSPIGVWGDTGVTGGIGLFGSADFGTALAAVNNSGGPTAFIANYVNDPSALLLEASGNSGLCTIDVSGNLKCNGTVTAVVPTGDGLHQVALNTISSPENWFEDAGSGQLLNGKAVVNIESVFGETVNTGVDYHVFVTPKGDCEGLYVSNETPTGFEVHELRNGHSSIAFDYRILAKRKGFEQIRLADKTNEMNASHPQRPEGPRPVLPTALEIRKAQEALLHATQLAKPVVNTK
jgi:hypothetical protein